jgi:DNA polymerase-3 subunit gamma/tau
MDVLEIDAASNTQVEKVRDSIIETISFAPARDRYKVFIIDEVHMLSTSSFNALLKTLEEPPPRVVFIMATTERHKLPETILSRTQQFEFHTIATTKIAERLRHIADEEKVNVSEEALREIARAGEGSMRDAQSAFDQVISFSGLEINVEDVETALGLASTEMLSRVMSAIAEQRPAERLTVVNELVMRGHDLRNFCRDLLGHLRDLLVARVYGETAEHLDSAAFDRRALVLQADSFSESDLVRLFHSLTDTERNLRDAAHPRYLLEVGLVKLIEMGRVIPLNNLIERLSALEKAIRTGAPPAETETPAPAGGARGPSGKTTSTPRGSRLRGSGTTGSEATAAVMQPTEDKPPFDGVEATLSSDQTNPVLTLVPPPSAPPARTGAAAASAPAFGEGSEPPTPIKSVTPATRPSTPDSPVEHIKAVLETRNRMFLVVALEGAHKATIVEDELCVEFAPEARHLRDNLAKPESVRLLREAAREVLGRDIGVRIVVTEKSNPNEPPSREEELRIEKQRLRALAEQDADIQKQLRTFRAEIVDVRPID